MDETMATREKDDLVFHKACELLKPYNRGNAALQMNTHISVDLEIDSVAVLDLIINVIIPFLFALWLTGWIYGTLVGASMSRSVYEPFWFVRSQRT